MLLFDHKQHLQSNNTQSSKQRKIVAFKEIVLRTTTNGLYGLHNISPGLLLLLVTLLTLTFT